MIAKLKNILKRKYQAFCFSKTLLDLKNNKDSKKFIKILNFKIEHLDALSLHWEIKNIFQNKIYHFFSNKKNPFIIDCGSYIGASILYFKSVYPNAEILGFEPDPKIYRILKRNIKRNNFNNIRVVQAGLGVKEGILEFFSDGKDGGSFYKINKSSLIKVPVKKLSNYIKKPVDLLKINIEGTEYQVIKEIEKKLNLINEIIIEYHCFNNLEQNLHKILAILDKNGFKYLITDIPCFKVKKPFVLKKPYKYFNLIYAKNETN